MHLNTPYNNCRDNGLGRGDGASDVLYICHKIAISGHTGLCVNEHKTQSTHQSAGNTAFGCPGKLTAPGAAPPVLWMPPRRRGSRRADAAAK
jgi:hypothetical protein